MISRTIPATTTGRYLIAPPDGQVRSLLVGFHGYGQSAEEGLADLQRLPPTGSRLLVSVQALNWFYRSRTDEVVANWMTRLEREAAIENNIHYIRDVVSSVRREFGHLPIAFSGFSQGAAMAYRAAASIESAALVVLGGDLPPDVSALDALPPLLLGRGSEDELYPLPVHERDIARLSEGHATFEVCAFEGGHEWAPAFTDRAAAFIAAHGV